MLVKKIHPDWTPAENPELAIGGTVDITDPSKLIEEGLVEVVKAKKAPVATKKVATTKVAAKEIKKTDDTPTKN